MTAKWGYGSCDGPATWANNFPDAKGNRQSPVAIKTSETDYDASLSEKPLKMTYYKEQGAQGMQLGNTGASMKADCTANSTMTGGPLGDKVYKLIQFHLHWGGSDNEGAEHIIDDKAYSAELHLVHWNSTDYGSFEEAANKSNGLAVLCMFIKPGNPHKEFELISRELGKVTCKGETTRLSEPFDPARLLPQNTKDYWTYPGSLTTPPCFESVQFILFPEVLEFSCDQLKALRSLHFGNKNDPCMVNNYRPCCPLGSRKVRASFK